MIETMFNLFPQSRMVIDDVRGETDVEAMVAIHGEGFHRGWGIDEFETLLAEPTVRCLLLRRETVFGTRRVLGFIMTRLVAGEAEVLTIAVAAARRGHGYGRRLIDEAIRRAYAEGIGEVFLEVSDSNPPALALYRRIGFREVGRRKGYYAEGGPGGTALVMRLQLR